MLAKDPPVLKAMTDIVSKAVNEEISNVRRRSENSALRKREYDGLADLSWKEIYGEIERKCPTTKQFLMTLVDGEDGDEKKIPPVCLMYSISMLLRVPELSRLRKLNTILLSDGGISKIVSFNSVYIFTFKN